LNGVHCCGSGKIAKTESRGVPVNDFGPSLFGGKEKYTYRKEDKFQVQSSMFEVGLLVLRLPFRVFGWKFKNSRLSGASPCQKNLGGLDTLQKSFFRASKFPIFVKSQKAHGYWVKWRFFGKNPGMKNIVSNRP